MPRPPDSPEKAARLDGALAAEAIALGRTWAEEKARQLELSRAPEDWPDFWDDVDVGPLPADLSRSVRGELQREATGAARERWRELVEEARAQSLLAEETHDSSTSAAMLEAAVQSSGVRDTE